MRFPFRYESARFRLNIFDPSLATSDYTRPSADAFYTQMQNIHKHLHFPILLTLTAVRFGLAQAAATQELTGNPMLSQGQSVAGLGKKIQELLNAMDSAEVQGSMVNENLKAAGSTLRKIADRYRLIIEPMEQLLVSAMLRINTALEIFLHDLWADALNKGPKELTANVLAVEGKAQPKSLQISVVQEFGYDLRERMGDVLEAIGKVNFQSLAGAFAAYQSAFGRTISVKKRNWADVIIMEAARNIWAHKNGQPDKRFRDAVCRASGSLFRHLWKNIPDERTVEITGVHVRVFAESAMAVAAAALKLVESSASPLQSKSHESRN